MNILVTGSAGFLGRNLVENLKTIRDGKNAARPNLRIDEIYEYSRSSTPEQLDEWCARADFVFHLAGVSRPKDPAEFQTGNVGLASALLDTLKKHKNNCPVMLSSSVQAALVGRFGVSEYGLSKRGEEELFFRHGEETGAAVYVYRFPNLAGKWVRPNHNSAVGSFCSSIANDLPITVRDPEVELELLFVEDLLEELYDCLEGHPRRCAYPDANAVINGVVYDGLTPRPAEDGAYCYAAVTHKATLGRIAECLRAFHDQPRPLLMPRMAPGSFEKKLYSMYLSYLPKEKAAFSLPMHADDRGSFTELFKTVDHGQVSVNISRPGATRGQHWHNSKWEIFVVVSGHGLIRERKLGTDEVIEFEVSGEKLQAVRILPGYAHSIVNLSETDPLVTVMWASEQFDPNRPDTFAEPV